MIIPVILCGGSGTCLWPLSRRCTPGGSWLGEDDIVRFEDNYGRVNKH